MGLYSSLMPFESPQDFFDKHYKGMWMCHSARGAPVHTPQLLSRLQVIGPCMWSDFIG